jgi:glutamine synthetase
MEILLENYSNIINIEALTSIDMARKQIAPAIIGYQKFVLEGLELKNKVLKGYNRLETSLADTLGKASDLFAEKLDALVLAESEYVKVVGTLERAKYAHDVLLKSMKELRKVVDETELIVGKEFIPFPIYEDILYSVKY